MSSDFFASWSILWTSEKKNSHMMAVRIEIILTKLKILRFNRYCPLIPTTFLLYHTKFQIVYQSYNWFFTNLNNKKTLIPLSKNQGSYRGASRIWTGGEGVADLCLTTWLSRHIIFLKAPRVGLEPTTTRLTAECSTIELSRNISLHLTKRKVDYMKYFQSSQDLFSIFYP